MIRAISGPGRYNTRFSNGKHDGVSDTTAGKGGGESGFRPHDLLEAALAACANMTVRMYADSHGIRLTGVATTVAIDRSQPGQVIFRYRVCLEGDLSGEQKRRLLEAAENCPVRRTLSMPIAFERTASE